MSSKLEPQTAAPEFSRHDLRKGSLAVEESIIWEDHEEQNMGTAKMMRILTEFRAGGKRYQCDEEHTNYFNIKHRQVQITCT